MQQYVIVTGASGFIGSALIPWLLENNFKPVLVSRTPSKLGDHPPDVTALSLNELPDFVSQHDPNEIAAIVNLAGESIDGFFWSNAKKKRLLSSRLNAAKRLLEIVEKIPGWPGAFIQASAVGFYGNRGDEILSEDSGKGSGFLSGLVEQWEDSIQPLQQQDIRTVWMRIGLVLGKNGAFLNKMKPLFRFFLGGHPGSGRQWISWIHLDDLLNFIITAIQNKDYAGKYNLVSPNPVQAKDFYQTLSKALHRPSWLPQPAFALKLALGEMADELLLVSQRVQPQQLLQSGFEFKLDDLEKALKNSL